MSSIHEKWPFVNRRLLSSLGIGLSAFAVLFLVGPKFAQAGQLCGFSWLQGHFRNGHYYLFIDNFEDVLFRMGSDCSLEGPCTMSLQFNAAKTEKTILSDVVVRDICQSFSFTEDESPNPYAGSGLFREFSAFEHVTTKHYKLKSKSRTIIFS